jgi:hypothetical protein
MSQRASLRPVEDDLLLTSEERQLILALRRVPWRLRQRVISFIYAVIRPVPLLTEIPLASLVVAAVVGAGW